MRTRHAAGFTIIELMIVVTIVAILATIAMPNLRDMIIRTRLKTAASDLHSALLFARSEAVKRNAAVTVSPTGGGSNWAVGWQVKSGTTVLTTQDSHANVTFTTKASTLSGATALAVTEVTYLGTGRATATSSPASSTVAFIVSATTGSAGTYARCLSIDPSGRPAFRTGSTSSGCT